MKLYLVGQFRAETEYGNVWDFQGIFNNKELAIRACVKDSYFFVPVYINESIPDEMSTDWKGLVYPKIKG